MSQKGQHNHYNIKFLKGYGFSISVKDSKIILKNTADPFRDPEVEEWYVKNMPYEKIVLSGKGYVSTEAIKLLSEKNINVLLTDTYGHPYAFMIQCTHDIQMVEMVIDPNFRTLFVFL